MNDELLKKVGAYYSEKVRQFGATPQGVDWNGEESQFIRFHQLMRVAEESDASFSLLDFGCGYGGMLDYLLPIYGNKMTYVGLDISEEMLVEARKKYGDQGDFYSELPADFKADYVVASGVFNVRQDAGNEEWLSYIHQTLDQLDALSTRGFSFNVLTSYSDKPYMRDYLYYASPEDLFGYCKTKFSKRVALLHDYPLYEFTIIVKKDLHD